MKKIKLLLLLIALIFVFFFQWDKEQGNPIVKELKKINCLKLRS